MWIQNLKLFSSFGSGFTGWTGVDTTLAPCCGICGANNTGLAEQIQAHRFDWIFFRFDRILRINISRFPLEDKYATQKTQAKKGLSENGTMNYLNDSILRKIEAKKITKSLLSMLTDWIGKFTKNVYIFIGNFWFLFYPQKNIKWKILTLNRKICKGMRTTVLNVYECVSNATWNVAIFKQWIVCLSQML